MKNTRLILFFIISGALSVPSCEPDKKMAVETGEVSNISVTTADVSGTVIDVGEGATQHGHCYGTNTSPEIDGTKTSLGIPVTGDFTSSLTGLQPETKYYVRAYCSKGKNVEYGSEIDFTTASASLAELTTMEITGITKTSAASGGNVTSEGGTPVTARGVCWNSAANPTTANNKTTDGEGSGSFGSSITGLEVYTKYYVRAYAINSGGTAYGNELSFTTKPEDPVSPTVTTTEVTSVTTNSAVSGGEVTSDGGASVLSRGVCWSTSSNPTIDNLKTTDGSGTGSFTSSITGLTPGTSYHVRAYATNSIGTSYGADIPFTTSVSVSVVTTTSISEITSTTAASGGNVISNGGTSVTARGVCWSTSSNPTITDFKTIDDAGTGSFVSSITELIPCTAYHVRAYATNSSGTAYGEDVTFTTGTVLPTMSTTPIYAITSTTASSGGNITGACESTVTAHGVCWSTTANPTTADSKTVDGTGGGSYTSSITGLTSGTAYHVRAYATNSAGTVYGEDIVFTAGAVIPTVTTKTISSITSATANSGGDVTSDGGTSVTARGVCWGMSSNPTIADSKTIDGNGTGSFTSSITGLTPGTLYHVRAYATNSVGTAYGEDVSFTSEVTIPAVTTMSVSAITSTTASSGGDVTSSGGASVTSRGVCWSILSNPTIADFKTTDDAGIGSFISSITGLTPCTTYHVRAYATNSSGTAYGEDVSFTAGTDLPIVTTTEISDITTTTASSGGNITGNCSATVTSRGVCWSTTASPTTSDSKTVNGTGGGSYTSSITGLTSGTTYHVRAYATNPAGTAYGEDIVFIAGAVLPVITTTAISSITSTTANSGGTITSDGGTPVTARGVCWSTSNNPTTANNKTDNGTGSGSFISNITGLSPGTLYYVRAYATSSAGTAYGTEQSFTTIVELPAVTTADVNSITSTTAASGGNITSNGGAAVTVRGVCWNTSPYPTTANSKTNDGSGTGAYTSSITGLKPGTLYYLRAYGTNSAGTGYGNEISFTTVAVLPTLTTTAVTAITETTATCGGNITSDGGATVTVRGVCWSTSQYPTISDSHTDDGSGAGSFVSSINGLLAITTYYVRAYATNGVGTVYGDQVTFNTALTVTHTAGDVAPVTKTVTYGTVVTNLTGEDKRWITRNLGAANQAASSTDTTEAAAGWYWQFNHKQGYKHDGITLTPSAAWLTSIDENSDWIAENDPCTILLGADWRIPTKTEWTNVDANGGWTGVGQAYISVLKIHAAGSLDVSGTLYSRYLDQYGNFGSGSYWSSTQVTTAGYAYYLWMNSVNCFMEDYSKRSGRTVRCLKD
jgi:uncharacterized protein (TIGR02145 family)